MKNKIKEILERETKGININDNIKNELIFSYHDVEKMLEEVMGVKSANCEHCNGSGIIRPTNDGKGVKCGWCKKSAEGVKNE